MERISLEERLFRRRYIDGTCWRWTGFLSAQGYAQLTVAKRVLRLHRVAYELWIGAIPDGMEIDHTCRIRDCFNPDHLEVVTHRENIRRSSWKPYLVSIPPRFELTHCAHGHEYSPENTRVAQSKKGPFKVCRTCHRAKEREYAEAKKARAA